MQTVHSFIREQRTTFETREIPLFEGADHSAYDTINKIDHYANNMYVDTAYDDIIGDYPFDNISKFRILLEARATDFDTKHIEVEPENSSKESKVSSMIVNKILDKKLKEIKFGSFLNKVCYTRPQYGGVLVKNVNGVPEVVLWENVIFDQTDIMSSPIIERSYYTPSEIMQQKGWKNTKEAVANAKEYRNKDIGDKGGERADTQGHFIEVFETVGIVPRSMLLSAQGKEYDHDDEEEFVLAQIITAGADWKDKDGEEMGVTFYAEEIKEHLYKYLARNPVAGRGLGIGIIEELFEHQKWHNFTKTEEMRMIAIAGKKVYKTNDPDVLENIFDEGIDHGTVLRVGSDKYLDELNQLPTGIPVYQNTRVEWDDSASRLTSSFGAKIGEEAKSGTPFRAQYLQNVEASSQFEQYREEIGIDLITPIVEEWVLPEAVKDYQSKESIYSTFTPQELQLIDDTITNKRLTEEFVRATLERKVVTPEEFAEMEVKIRKDLAKSNKREIKGIKEFIKNAPKKVTVRTTDESRNKAVYFESLANTLQLLAPEDPRRNAIIDRIMDAIGIPKEELEIYLEEATPTNANPQLETEELKRANQAGVKVTPS